MTSCRLEGKFVALVWLLTVTWTMGLGTASTAAAQQAPQPTVSVARPPVGAEGEAQGVHWVQVAAPGVGVMLMAIARPEGEGPFPAVLLLHGTHGFAHEYVHLAQALARGGVLAVAACWFAAGRGAGTRFITAIPCPEGPPLLTASAPQAMQVVEALVQAVRTLPEVRPGRLALFGHSLGAGATLNYSLLGGTEVRAAVLNSGPYTAELIARAPEIKVPILMLHGTADSPDDGGSASTNVDRAREFESALQRGGRMVEAHYYDGGRHNSLFTSAMQFEDEAQRITAFLKRRLLE